MLAGTKGEARIQRQRDPTKWWRVLQVRAADCEPTADALLGKYRAGAGEPAIRWRFAAVEWNRDAGNHRCQRQSRRKFAVGVANWLHTLDPPVAGPGVAKETDRGTRGRNRGLIRFKR